MPAAKNFFLKEQAKQDLAAAKVELNVAQAATTLGRMARQSKAENASSRIKKAEAILTQADEWEPLPPETKITTDPVQIQQFQPAQPRESLQLQARVFSRPTETEPPGARANIEVGLPRNSSSVSTDLMLMMMQIQAMAAISGARTEVIGPMPKGALVAANHEVDTGVKLKQAKNADTGNVIEFAQAQRHALQRQSGHPQPKQSTGVDAKLSLMPKDVVATGVISVRRPVLKLAA